MNPINPTLQNGNLQSLKRSFASVLALFGIIGAPAVSQAAPFTPGNVVVYRIGNGTSEILANTGNSIFLDEFTPAGSLVQSIALPNSGSNAVIASGTATSEGMLSRSGDGQLLVVTGYNTAVPYTGSLSGSTSAAVNRAVAIVNASGAVASTTKLSDWASGNNPRSAVTNDGTQLWLGGALGGVRYVSSVAATTGTQINTPAGLANFRQVAIFDGQLYATTNSTVGSNTTSIGTVGSGLPTTSAAYTTLSGIAPAGTITGTSRYAFFFADLSAGVAGVDTLYIADDGALALSKYSRVGGNWVLNNTIGVEADDYRGVTGTVSGSTVTLFATRKGGSSNTGGGELVKIIDASGYNASISASPTVLASAIVGIATAPNTSFRGVAIAPGNVVVLPSVNLSVSASAGTEAGTTAITVTATASAAVTGDQTVDLAVTGTGITAGDYSLSNSTITILNGATTGTVTFTVTDDALAEVTETATLTISNPTSGIALGATTAQNVAITDNDSPPAVNLSVSASTGTEAGATVITVTATASAAVVGDQTVNLAVTGTGITAGDYSLSNATITILDGQTTGAVTFTVVNDAFVEGTETATLTISSPSSGLSLGATIAQNVAITDDDIQTVDLSVSANAGTETDVTAITVTATASAAVIGDQTVSLAATGTGITAGDYSLSNATITILNGQTTGTATFTVVDDATYEGEETAVLTISSPSLGLTLGATTMQNVVITDNDPAPPPAVNLSVSASTGTETAATVITVTATSSSAVIGDQTVDLSVSGTEITAGDYTLSGASITILSGQTTGTATFTIVNDAIFEGTETATLTISNPTAGISPGATMTRDVVIADNDAGVGALMFTAINADEDGFAMVALRDIPSNTTVYFSENEWDGVSAFNSGEAYLRWDSGISVVAAGTVIRFLAIDAIGRSASVGSLTLASGSAGLGATEESIYAYQSDSFSGTPTFISAICNRTFGTAGAGSLAATGLSIGNGAIQTGFSGGSEFAEYTGLRNNKTNFAAYLAQVSNIANWTDSGDGTFAATVPNTTAFTLAAIPSVQLSVSANAGTEADATVITVTSTASGAVTGDQTVSLAVTGTGITAGDYTLSNAVITILDGQTTGTVTFTVVDDAAVEATETATLTISSPSSGMTLGATTTQNVAITDNDPNLVNLSVSANAGSETEATVITVTATTSAAVMGDQTVNLAVTGTGITAGDYTLSNAVITILSGQTTGTVTFTVVDDAAVEATETATLTISSPSPGISLGSTLSQDIVITDNDLSLTPIETWRQLYFNTTENSGLTADEADYDGDGVLNLMEYALGSNPTLTTANEAQAALPVGTLNDSGDPLLSDRYSLSFTINSPAPTDLTYTVEAGDDLENWTSVAQSTGDSTWTWLAGGTSHIVVGTPVAGRVTIKVGDMEPLTGHPKRVIRLKVNK